MNRDKEERVALPIPPRTRCDEERICPLLRNKEQMRLPVKRDYRPPLTRARSQDHGGRARLLTYSGKPWVSKFRLRTPLNKVRIRVTSKLVKRGLYG